MKNLLSTTAQMIQETDISNVPMGYNLDNARTGDILQVVFGIFAAVAVLVIAVSAFKIVISRGNPDDVSKARDAIIYAAVGLAISMLAVVIVRFVVDQI